MNLSDKRTYTFEGTLEQPNTYCYVEEDVKQFIKEINDEFCECENIDRVCRFCIFIKTKAGEKLI